MAEELRDRILHVLANRVVTLFKNYGINVTVDNIFAVTNMQIQTSNTCTVKLSKSKNREEKQCPRPCQAGSAMCAYHNNRKRKQQNANAPTPITSLFVPSLSLQGIAFIPVTKDQLVKPLPSIPLSSLPKPALPDSVTSLPN